MSFDVTILPLEDCLDALIDYRGKTPVKTDSGIPLITAKVIKGGRIEIPTEFIAIDNYDSWMRRGLPKSGDVVLTVEAPLGEVAQLGPEKIALAQRVVTLRGKAGLLDSTYLLYLLQTEEMQSQLKSRATGTTVLGIKQSELRKVTLTLPPFELQLGAAATLKALDDRITLLRETNATLEAIAQALFKSWFVDFDPVRAKLEGRAPEGMDEATAALFPDGFEESELGLVPRGWRVSQCQDLFEVRDGTHESPKPSLEGYPLVTSKHITSGRVNFQDTYLISEGDYAAISKRSKVNHLDVLITMIGTVGLSAILLDERNDFAIKNIGLFKTSAAPNFAYFLSLLLKSKKMQEYLSARLAGTTQNYLSLKALREIGLLVPSETVLVEFSKIASTLFEGIHRNNQQAQTISTLRDTLLPRLISGQLRLPEAEALLEEACA